MEFLSILSFNGLDSCERFQMVLDEETTSTKDCGVQINKFCAMGNIECVCACACAWSGRLRDWVFRRGAIVTNTRTPVIRTLPSDIRCVLSGWLCSVARFFCFFRLIFSCLFPFNSLVLLRCRIFSHRSPSNCGLRMMTSITEGPERLYRLLIHSSFFPCLSFSLSLSFSPCLLCPPGDLQ